MKKVVYGIMLIAIAICIVLSAMGVGLGFISQLSVVDIILSIALLIFAFNLILDRAYPAIPFPIMIMFFFLEDDIARFMGRTDENLISNWLVLLCTVLVSMGISLIYYPVKKKQIKTFCAEKKGNWGKEGNKTMFSSDVKYVDCANFNEQYYHVNMGNLDVQFTNTEEFKGGLLRLSCNMGNINVYVPRGWNIKTEIDNHLGNVDIPSKEYQDGPILNIEAQNSMGNIEIIFRD